MKPKEIDEWTNKIELNPRSNLSRQAYSCLIWYYEQL